ncbi:MAG: BatD family protein [Runella sp.]
MNSKCKIWILFWGFWWSSVLSSHGQIVQNPFVVEYSNTKISLNEPFTVSVKITDVEQVPTISFPELANFQRRETTKSSLTNTIGGKTTVTHTFSQNYYPLKVGTFNIGNFNIIVNKQVLNSEGTTVVVSSDIKSNEEIIDNPEVGFDPGLENITDQGAFLAVSVSKRNVYVQEGFNLRLSLLVSESNTADMEFYEVEKQLEKILVQIKPANCWEENFELQEIPPIPITIRGKRFTEYRIYQASFFSLHQQTIQIPAVGLTMKVLGQSTDNSKKFYLQTFYSKPLKIQVRNLPGHHSRQQVFVGTFKMEEKVSNLTMTTGESYRYEFKIIGEGNLQSIREPIFATNALFDVYPPEIESNILRQKGVVRGEKNFKYQIIPKQNGVIPLQNLIYWVYFDPQKQRYDTLRSSLTLTVNGENLQTTQLNTSDPTSLYTGIEHWDTAKLSLDYKLIIRNIANVLIIAMLIVMIFLFRK